MNCTQRQSTASRGPPGRTLIQSMSRGRLHPLYFVVSARAIGSRISETKRQLRGINRARLLMLAMTESISTAS